MGGENQIVPKSLKLVCVIVLTLLSISVDGSYPDQVLLRDVQVLTLRQGHMTAGRRSSPVPQLKCVGGTAGCTAFVPQIVQCYNRGSDGTDIQWECKTDMDNAYRFGRTDVTCEGYNYPEDPYILRGSCGVEYTIDLTKEAYDHHRQQQHSYERQTSKRDGQGDPDSLWSSIVILIIIGFIFYGIYKAFLAPSTHQGQNPPGDPPRHGFDPPPPYAPRDDGHDQRPPPPGFKPEYSGSATGSSYVPPPHVPGTSAYGGSWGGNSGRDEGHFRSSGATYRGDNTGFFGGSRTETHTVPPNTHQARNNDGPGFWSGLGTGGILGYLFGSRNQQPSYPGGGGYGGSG